MTLDQELRATLGLEAELRTPPPPDVVGLIHGGRIRRRRRSLTRLGVAAVATVAVAATALGVVQLDPRAGGDVASPPSATPRADLPRSSDGRAVIEPGTYRMFVGRGATGGRIDADVTLEGTYWREADFPMVSDQEGATYAGFGVYQPQALAAGKGCESDPTDTDLARTAPGLAAQLAALPRSTVLREPEQSTVLGLPATHLRLRIGVECDDYYRVAHAPGGSRGITFTPPGVEALDVVIDFWVLELDGALLVVDQWHNLDTPASLVDRATDARRSITVVAEGRVDTG